MANKYWLAENGTVRCLDQQCPTSCSMSCPIYVQTIALEKLMMNRFSEAADLLKKAVAIEPTFADAWNNLAASYGQMGDHKNAFEAYRHSYDLLKKPNPLYGMAVATKNMKDYDKARQYTQMYVNTFGADGRITALIAEIDQKNKKGLLGKLFRR